jgi:hypothetical protein
MLLYLDDNSVWESGCQVKSVYVELEGQGTQILLPYDII